MDNGANSFFRLAPSGPHLIIAEGGGDPVTDSSVGTLIIHGAYPIKEPVLSGETIAGASAPRGGAGASFDRVSGTNSSYHYCFPAQVPGGAGMEGCNEPTSAVNGANGRVILYW